MIWAAVIGDNSHLETIGFVQQLFLSKTGAFESNFELSGQEIIVGIVLISIANIVLNKHFSRFTGPWIIEPTVVGPEAYWPSVYGVVVALRRTSFYFTLIQLCLLFSLIYFVSLTN